MSDLSDCSDKLTCQFAHIYKIPQNRIAQAGFDFFCFSGNLLPENNVDGKLSSFI